jgi:hypothetical protein
MKARLSEPAARHYVIAGIVRGAKPSPQKKKKCFDKDKNFVENVYEVSL